MSALTSDDDEETVNLVSATITFSSCALLFGLKRKGVILWHCDNDNRSWYTDGATTLSRMNISGYVGHVTIFS